MRNKILTKVSSLVNFVLSKLRKNSFCYAKWSTRSRKVLHDVTTQYKVTFHGQIRQIVNIMSAISRSGDGRVITNPFPTKSIDTSKCIPRMIQIDLFHNPFTNVREWIGNFKLRFTGHVITNPKLTEIVSIWWRYHDCEAKINSWMISLTYDRYCKMILVLLQH